MIATAKKIDNIVPVTRFMRDGGHHRWQIEMLQAFDSGRYFDGPLKRWFYLVWHRRARKSTLGINLLIRECVKNPKGIFDIVFPSYKMAKSVIWRDPMMLDSFLPDQSVFGWEKNASDLLVRFENESMLILKGADNPDSLRGPRCGGVWFDEYSIMNPDVVMAVYRPILAEDPKRWAAFASTPAGQNHYYEEVNKARNDPDSYLSILPATESNLIQETELEKAKQEMPEALFEQEFLCHFVTEEECSYISSKSLEALRDVPRIEPKPKTFISVDPALTGDEFCAMVFDNTKLIALEVYRDHDLMKLVGYLVILARKFRTKNFVVETAGLGIGVKSRLKEMGYHVIGYEPAATATDSEHFANKKAEIWWDCGQMVRDKVVEYPEDLRTRQQISAVKYKTQGSSGKIICEPKDQTRKRIGCSPDRADCWIQGISHVQRIPIDGQKRKTAVPDYIKAGIG